MANVKFEYSGKLSDGRFFDEDSKKKIVFELEDSDLSVDEMLEEFMNFMQAIGYRFDVGDRFDVVNDFKARESKTQATVDDYKIDLSKYDPIVDESGTVVGAAEKIKQVDPYALGAEIDRLRDVMVGMSEEALEMAAYHNLMKRGAI